MSGISGFMMGCYIKGNQKKWLRIMGRCVATRTRTQKSKYEEGGIKEG